MSTKKKILLLIMILILILILILKLYSPKNNVKRSASNTVRPVETVNQSPEGLNKKISALQKLKNNAPETSMILVANKKIIPGEVFANGSMKWQSWPSNALEPGMIMQQKRPSAITEMSDYRAATTIHAGEPLTSDKFSKNTLTGYLASVLRDNMRAITVPISPTNSVGGFILPGDYIDIMFTPNTRLQNIKPIPKILISNAHVLAVGNTTKTEALLRTTQNLNGNSFTLELTERQVLMVREAANAGNITYILRSAKDFPKDSTSHKPHVITDLSRILTPPSTSITYVKKGIISEISNN